MLTWVCGRLYSAVCNTAHTFLKREEDHHCIDGQVEDEQDHQASRHTWRCLLLPAVKKNRYLCLLAITAYKGVTVKRKA